MANTLPLEQMDTEEKLRAMEELWESLTRSPDAIPTPDWHREVLDERDARLRRGEADIRDWQSVKRRLQDKAR